MHMGACTSTAVAYQADNLAQIGWSAYKRGEYEKTAAYYEQVFELREDCPGYYYHLMASTQALLGDEQKALRYLKEAVEHGWSDAEYSQDLEEFQALQAYPEWKDIMAQMGEGG